MRRLYGLVFSKLREDIPVMLPESQFQIKTVIYVKRMRRLNGLVFSKLREDNPVMPPDSKFFK